MQSRTCFFTVYIGDCSSLFAIDSVTGEMTIAGDIDRDSGDIMENGGMCQLNILVRIPFVFNVHVPLLFICVFFSLNSFVYDQT